MIRSSDWIDTPKGAGSQRDPELFVRCASGRCGCHSHNGFLTRRGYERMSHPAVDKAEAFPYLDKVVSVSASEGEGECSVWDEVVIEEQHQRFLNAS